MLAHMGVARGLICGVPLLLFRVSFSGELGFEVNVPADFGRAVWEAIFVAGQPHGLTAYGTETMHVLRAEKGYIIVGQDTDGTVTPDDVGLAWAIGQTKADFVGKRSLERPAMRAPQRKQLVASFAPMGRPCSRKARRWWRRPASERRCDSSAMSPPPITAPSSDTPLRSPSLPADAHATAKPSTCRCRREMCRCKWCRLCFTTEKERA